MKIGLLRAYRGVGVNPDKYLKHLRRAYGLHVTSFREMNTVAEGQASEMTVMAMAGYV